MSGFKNTSAVNIVGSKGSSYASQAHTGNRKLSILGGMWLLPEEQLKGRKQGGS